LLTIVEVLYRDPYERDEEESWYDVMQVCLNGHQITSTLKSNPQLSQIRCNKCGEKTISECPKCGENIRGYYHVAGVLSLHSIPIPEYCHKCGEPYPWQGKIHRDDTEEKIIPNQVLEKIFTRIHQVIKQLRDRHDGRQTLDARDEYDVQDLLHALLRIYFDNIKPEEWNSSYAGSQSRSDFLLPREKTIIEVKDTRRGINNSKLKKELIEDKEQYKKNSQCKTLYCLVYDPEGRIVNPRGFEDDINEESAKFVCRVMIVPT
jgi:hypothetical protein